MRLRLNQNDGFSVPKIFIGILAHNKPTELAELILALEDFEVIVHIDRGADRNAFLSKLSAIHQRTSIIDLQDSEFVNWGGISVVDAEMRIVTEYLRVSSEDSYLVFLSGECFPIRPLRDFKRELLSQNQTFFCNVQNIQDLNDSRGESLQSRYTKIWLRDLKVFERVKDRSSILYKLRNFMIRIGQTALNTISEKKKILEPVMVGSQWLAGSHLFFRKAFESYPSYREEFKYALAPDEMIFQTLYYRERDFFINCPIHLDENPVINAPFHLIHESLNYIWQPSDYENIKESKKFFIRKPSLELRAKLNHFLI